MIADTESVCPVCLRTLPARRVGEGDCVYLEKTCPEHGFFRTLIWEGLPDYWSWGSHRTPTRPLTTEGTRLGCPHDCGLCGQHRQRTCCVLLEITHRCNLCCPVCFAESQAEGADPSLDTIAGWYDILRRQAGQANIQLSGGEPTVRDDLPDIIRLGREKGFTYFQLNTNGLRLAREPGYARKLKQAGLSCVFLQFDGVTDGPYQTLRGAPLLEEKKRAIQNCADARLGVVLVPVVAPGVNLDQLGAILDFALEWLPVVRGVHFQPITYFGRFPGQPHTPLTLPRLLREIEAQTNGRFHATDFSGGTAEHSHCSFSGNFLLEANGTVQALKPQGGCCCAAPEPLEEEEGCCCATPEPAGPDCCCAPPRSSEASCCCAVPVPPEKEEKCCCAAPKSAESDCCCAPPQPSEVSCCCAVPEPLEEEKGCCCAPPAEDAYTAVEHARDTVARRWGGAVPPEEAPPDDPDSLDGALYQLKHRRFSVSAMAFQDCWSLDLERLRNCYIHIMSPDGRLIPFCAYNLTSAEGRPLHRLKNR